MENQNEKLVWIVDALIPEDPELDMPSASQLGVPETFLPRVFKARPDLAQPFSAIIGGLPDLEPDEGLSYIKSFLNEQEFYLLSRTIAAAYFLDEGINRRLKYPGQEALDYDPDYDEIMNVIQRVIDRGNIYVDP